MCASDIKLRAGAILKCGGCGEEIFQLLQDSVPWFIIPSQLLPLVDEELASDLDFRCPLCNFGLVEGEKKQDFEKKCCRSLGIFYHDISNWRALGDSESFGS